MNERLHPLTLGEVLDRTAYLYRTRFLVYFGIGVIPAATILFFGAVSVGLVAWAGSGGTDAATTAARSMALGAGIVVLGLVAVPTYLGATALGWAAMAHVAARDFLGEPTTIRQAYGSVLHRGWRYLWLYVLAALIVVGGPLVVFIGLSLGSGVMAGLASAAGMGDLSTVAGILVVFVGLALAVYCVLALLAVCLAFPASVVEEISAWQSVRRVWTLSRGTRGRIFLLFLLGLALSWLLMIGFSLPALIAIAVIPGLSGPAHAELAGEFFMFAWYAISFAVQAFTRPVFGIALTLFYFDQRIRKEGFDIEWLMRGAGMAMPVPEAEAISSVARTGAAQPQPVAEVGALPNASVTNTSEAGFGAIAGSTEEHPA